MALAMFLDLLFSNPQLYFTIVVVVIGSIVVHELGHALVATWEGDPTPRMLGHFTWNPRVHMGWFSIILVAVMGIGWGATPVNPRYFRHRRWGDVLVSLAGVTVNLLLAVIGAAALAQMLHSGARGEVPAAIATFWEMVLRFNVLLFLFNLIPMPPLDGFAALEGTFDLGQLGDMLRRSFPLPLLVVILILRWDQSPFYAWVEAIQLALLGLFGLRA